jgi:hypothetical protein
MTRKQALIAIRAAGSQNDQHTFLRLYTENRISFSVAREAFDLGRRMGREWTPETARQRVWGTFGT